MPELRTDADRAKAKPTNSYKLEDYLGSSRFLDHLKQILPEHLDSDRFSTIAMRQIRQIPELKLCALETVAASVMEAGTLGLEIGTQGECWLIPRMNSRKDDDGEWQKEWEATLQIGYLGHLALAWRSTQISAVMTDVVCAGDKFKFQRGTDGYLHHIPAKNRDLDAKNIEWAYAIVKTIYGGEVWQVMDKADIERLRNSGPSANSPAWKNWYCEMSQGKVLKRTLKFCPKSSELGRAINIDDRNDANLRPDYTHDVPIGIPERVPEDENQAAFRRAQEEASRNRGGSDEPPASGDSDIPPETHDQREPAMAAKPQQKEKSDVGRLGWE